MLAAEYIRAKKSKGEVLVFRRNRALNTMSKSRGQDLEMDSSVRPAMPRTRDQCAEVALEQQVTPFQWRNVCYDVKIKGETRRILDHVDGWVRPGTLTALMVRFGARNRTILY